MSTRVFFYGLYMDATLLESLGLHPDIIGAAKLDDFAIRIGERATVVPANGESCYGFLHDLPKGDVNALYSRPEVHGYVPRRVKATLLYDLTVHPASCYVLEPSDKNYAANREYVARLASMVSDLGFPSAYVDEIRDLADAQR